MPKKSDRTYTLSLTAREFRLVMKCVHQRGFRVHPADADPETFLTLTDALLESHAHEVFTCSADDHRLASCERQPGFPDPTDVQPEAVQP